MSVISDGPASLVPNTLHNGCSHLFLGMGIKESLPVESSLS